MWLRQNLTLCDFPFFSDFWRYSLDIAEMLVKWFSERKHEFVNESPIFIKIVIIIIFIVCATWEGDHTPDRFKVHLPGSIRTNFFFVSLSRSVHGKEIPIMLLITLFSSVGFILFVEVISYPWTLCTTFYAIRLNVYKHQIY